MLLSSARSSAWFLRIKESTVKNFVQIVQGTLSVTNSRAHLELIYINLVKAFDSVNHKILLQKLFNTDQSPNLLDGIEVISGVE